MSSPSSYGNGLNIELADDAMSATIKLDREENESPLTEEKTLQALKSTERDMCLRSQWQQATRASSGRYMTSSTESGR